MSDSGKAARIAAVQARLGRYIAVGEEINAELKALGLDVLVCNGVRRVRGAQEAMQGGVGYQPRARMLADLLGRVAS